MEKNKRKREWEDALNLMTEEELNFVMEHHAGYYPNFLKMAEARIWAIKDDPYADSEKQAMVNAITNILGEIGSYHRINQEDEIVFVFQGADFSIRFDSHYNYIDIFDNSWKKIDLDCSNAVHRMKQAINKANIYHRLTMSYIIDEEEQVMEIYSASDIPYFTNQTYLKKNLLLKLSDMLESHAFVDYYLRENECISMNQPISTNTAN